jgi:hypothetical protein
MVVFLKMIRPVSLSLTAWYSALRLFNETNRQNLTEVSEVWVSTKV